MKKTIEYTIKREIEYFEIAQNSDNIYCAYRTTFQKGNMSPSITEGVTLLSSIENSEYGDIVNTEYFVYKKEIEEISKKSLFFTNGKKFESLLIQNPYTYLFNPENRKNVGLYNVSWSDFSLYDINNEKLPTALYFGYIDGGVHNGNYDLENALKVLSDREDITFIKKINDDSIIPDEIGVIQCIPHYNCYEDHTHCLEFMWIPEKEDFNKVNNMKDTLSRKDNIIQEIFKINKINN